MAFVAEEIVVVTQEGVAVDLLVWRKFKRPMPGYVERVFDVNPNLAKLVEFIPVGTSVVLPSVNTDIANAIDNPILLWD